MNTLTGIKKLAAYGALLGGISAAALGIGTGLAHADSPTNAAPATHQSAPRHDGDQDVVRRGTVIPIHGDDSTHRGQ
ncbi:hypothetical protein FHT40_003820 [Mycolicibacterium sp. BK556]|uniref:hypothetical protein n=1 Tax=Mycobacteriaceae TaxID=1762 RepID=UPI00105E9108|nr:MULTISPECIES: hypothetical protein [Mycobacteriaceae]MBB3604159.1 hypothetical protein [Mycolicibacterium sp. BK556]MBB3634355.1 hypothetical protein [Mycolicibacterium sp. BK607]MBB3751935.1 hypothetical protein [Mycolicibacterium sp. BK634]TDO12449.1 hypothetical protein EV580_4176 [Mycobacterium sp. BK086]